MIILAFFVYLVSSAAAGASREDFFETVYKWGIATLLWLIYLAVA